MLGTHQSDEEMMALYGYKRANPSSENSRIPNAVCIFGICSSDGRRGRRGYIRWNNKKIRHLNTSLHTFFYLRIYFLLGRPPGSFVFNTMFCVLVLMFSTGQYYINY